MMTPVKKVKQRLTDDLIAMALRKTAGLLHPAAATLGVSRRTLQRRISKSATLREVQAESVEITLDIAEASLIRSIQQGAPWAVCFFLKCKGKARGWNERTEITGAGGAPLQVQVAESDLDRIIAGQ